MPKTNVAQTNFTGGELSNQLFGRFDLDKYENACRRLENFIVQKWSGITRRPGTKYLETVKDSSKAARLIPFAFSTTQTYWLEFGDLYIRFYTNLAQLTSGGSPVEVATTFTESELFDIKYTQSNDLLYLCHPDHQPQVLSRVSATSFSLDDFDFLDGPFDAENTTTANTLAPSGTTGAITITAAGGHTPFAATDVGRLVRIRHTNTYGCAKITGFTSSTVVDATVQTGYDFGATSAVSVWRLGAWTDTPESGSTSKRWPWVPQFHDNRLWFMGSNSNPMTVWGSESGDYDKFSPSDPTDADTVLATNSPVRTMDANQVHAIRWGRSVKHGMVIGTDQGEALLSSSSTTEGIAPDTISLKLHTPRGSHSQVEPQVIGESLIFTQASGQTVRELAFSFERDQLTSPDMTLLSEHVTGTGLVQSAYQQEPHSIYWACRADGQLVGLTFEREQEIIAWHRHVIGGFLDGSTHPEVESVAAIRHNGQDLLGMIVKRTVGGATKKFVEYMTPYLKPQGTDLEDFYHVDAGLTYDGAAATSISGLDHLNSENVAILADGAVVAEKMVVGGKITLSQAASVVHVGLNEVSVCSPMPPVPKVGVVVHGKRMSIKKAYVQLHGSMGGEYLADNLEER